MPITLAFSFLKHEVLGTQAGINEFLVEGQAIFQRMNGDRLGPSCCGLGVLASTEAGKCLPGSF